MTLDEERERLGYVKVVDQDTRDLACGPIRPDADDLCVLDTRPSETVIAVNGPGFIHITKSRFQVWEKKV